MQCIRCGDSTSIAIEKLCMLCYIDYQNSFDTDFLQAMTKEDIRELAFGTEESQSDS